VPQHGAKTKFFTYYRIYLSFYLSFYCSIYRSIYLSIVPSIFLSIFLSYRSLYRSFYLDFYRIASHLCLYFGYKLIYIILHTFIIGVKAVCVASSYVVMHEKIIEVFSWMKSYFICYENDVQFSIMHIVVLPEIIIIIINLIIFHALPFNNHNAGQCVLRVSASVAVHAFSEGKKKCQPLHSCGCTCLREI